MSEEIPTLKEVFDLAETADRLEQRQLYSEAQKVYEEAVAKLLPLIES